MVTPPRSPRLVSSRLSVCSTWLLQLFHSTLHLEYPVGDGDPIKIIGIMPALSFAYQCHMTSVPLYGEMRQRSTTKYLVVVGVAMFLATLFYVIVGLAGLAMFGGDVRPDVILNFPANSILITIGKKLYGGAIPHLILNLSVRQCAQMGASSIITIGKKGESVTCVIGEKGEQHVWFRHFNFLNFSLSFRKSGSDCFNLYDIPRHIIYRYVTMETRLNDDCHVAMETLIDLLV
eukprot:sb/3469359/